MTRSIVYGPYRGPASANRQPRRALGAAMLSDLAWQEVARGLCLSGRELQIVRGVFDNRKEHAIAADHGIADCTVHTHLRRLYAKLAVTTRVELVLRVVDTLLQPKLLPPSACRKLVK